MMAAPKVFFTFALFFAVAAAVQPITDFYKGELTYFGGSPDGMDPANPSYGTLEGSCGYGTVERDAFPYFSTAAFSPSNEFYQAGPVNACGQCFQIQCEDPRSGACKTDTAGKPLSVLVMITDECPECEADHLDAQALAFAKIADPAVGRIKIQYRRVECAIPGDMKVSVTDFVGSGGWIRLTVEDTGGRGAVQQVFVKGSNEENWRAMDNQWGAAWETGSAPQPPLDFKFTCDDSSEVLTEDVIRQNGGISGGLESPVQFSTGAQFDIADPAVQTVQAFDGNSDPMLVTSSTPGATDNGTSPSVSSSSSSGICTDIQPEGDYSCEQQKSFGKCGETFMQGKCDTTCGRCTSNSSSLGGRKLLRQR